jgi:hypothetical protein
LQEMQAMVNFIGVKTSQKNGDIQPGKHGET